MTLPPHVFEDEGDGECCDPQWNEEHQSYEHSSNCDRYLISEANSGLFPNPQLPPPRFGK